MSTIEKQRDLSSQHTWSKLSFHRKPLPGNADVPGFDLALDPLDLHKMLFLKMPPFPQQFPDILVQTDFTEELPRPSERHVRMFSQSSLRSCASLANQRWSPIEHTDWADNIEYDSHGEDKALDDIFKALHAKPLPKAMTPSKPLVEEPSEERAFPRAGHVSVSVGGKTADDASRIVEAEIASSRSF
ncbi:MAG: hypothetical protein Q9194_001460 [Teloschistes cf. exilis]